MFYATFSYNDLGITKLFLNVPEIVFFLYFNDFLLYLIMSRREKGLAGNLVGRSEGVVVVVIFY